MAVRTFILFAIFQFTFIMGHPETKTDSFFDKVNYNTKHVRDGEPMPPRSAKLRLYGMRFCPYTEKVVQVLNAKNLDYDVVMINLQHKPDWFLRINRKGTVPVLETEDKNVLIDSNIISVYLDEQYPQVPLQATDPLRRAQDKMMVEIFSSAQSAFNTAAYHPKDIKPATLEEFKKGLQFLEDILKSHATTFLFGNQPGLVDFAIWPFLERFETLPLFGRSEFAIEKTKYSLVISYMDAMKALPVSKAFYLPPETHVKFMESKIKGEPDYDILTRQ